MIFYYITAKEIIPWRDYRKLLRMGFLIVAFIVLSSPIASAYEVELAWNPSISVVDGYRIFKREEWDTYNYDSPEWEGSDTTCAINGLAEGIVYCFVVRAFNEYGESGNSNEVRTSTANSWVRINGSISHEGIPLCAMVLANGQYMFTCGTDDLGMFDLEVPLDENGEITLFGFCAELEPFEIVLTPDQTKDFDIEMITAPVGSPEMTVTVQSEPGTINPSWIRITGIVIYDETPLCVMVLANGQHMFTCTDPIGSYDMEVPLNKDGEILLYVFCSGMLPYQNLFMP